MNKEKLIVDDNFEKALVEQESVTAELNSDFDFNETKRINFVVNGVTFETFFKASSTKRLFVLYPGGGRRRTNTRFDRVSWSSKLNGNVLCIEDPMYKIHPGIYSGWFYGDEKNFLMDDVVCIIEKIISRKKISRENVVHIGSSCGGHSAVYGAHSVSGSTALVFNPQLVLDAHKTFFDLEKKLGHQVTENNISGRRDLRSVFKNPDSKYIIWSNIECRDDKMHTEYAVKEFGGSLSTGVHIYGNTVFLTNRIKSTNPHMDFSYLTPEHCMMLMDNVTRESKSLAGSVNDLTTTYINEKNSEAINNAFNITNRSLLATEYEAVAPFNNIFFLARRVKSDNDCRFIIRLQGNKTKLEVGFFMPFKYFSDIEWHRRKFSSSNENEIYRLTKNEMGLSIKVNDIEFGDASRCMTNILSVVKKYYNSVASDNTRRRYLFSSHRKIVCYDRTNNYFVQADIESYALNRLIPLEIVGDLSSPSLSEDVIWCDDKLIKESPEFEGMRIGVQKTSDPYSVSIVREDGFFLSAVRSGNEFRFKKNKSDWEKFFIV